MTRITIAPIVEGHGDNDAVRTLLQRVWMEMLGGEYAEVFTPIRRSRGKFLKEDSIDLDNAVNLAALKLSQTSGPKLVLILVDAEDDCNNLGPLGPLILRRAKEARGDVDISCVIANIMYETWFVAAAESLIKYFDLTETRVPDDPELHRCGKTWVKQRMRLGKYTETADQAALTATMDIAQCRQRSRSFDKLCRELEKRLKQ